MKKYQIKVGQKYTNPKFPGVIYMGVGESNTRTGKFFNKNMIVLGAKEFRMVGCMFQFTDNSKEWTNFIPYNKV